MGCGYSCTKLSRLVGMGSVSGEITGKPGKIQERGYTRESTPRVYNIRNDICDQEQLVLTHGLSGTNSTIL